MPLQKLLQQMQLLHPKVLNKYFRQHIETEYPSLDTPFFIFLLLKSILTAQSLINGDCSCIFSPPPIANTVLRNATGYFSFHYRRYFRTPPLSCPITLSGIPPISSAMSRGRVDQALISSPYILRCKTQGGRGGVTWPNNRQSVYNSSLNTIKKLLRTSHLHDSYRIHFLLSQKNKKNSLFH